VGEFTYGVIDVNRFNPCVIFIIINSQLSNSKKKRPYKNIFLSTQLKESKFFKVFEGHGFDIERRVRELLNRYVDFDFSIDLKAKKVSFSREMH
jgi:hypothetical protein